MLRDLAQITEEPGKLTRTFLSPAMRRANLQVGRWMAAAGLSVREDGAGNVIGRVDATDQRGKTLVLGSHLDTVREAGRYDGALGVLLPIVVLAELRRRGRRLPFAVEVVGFAEEEGVRFGSAYLGSKAFSGTMRARDLDMRDAAGISVREVLEGYQGRQFSLPKPAHRRADLIGYCEVHIEQGPVLESNKMAVGVVSAIIGQSRGQLTFVGQAGHAGTTPMGMRRDALAGAAEFVLAVEKMGRRSAGLVATVGTLRVGPGAPNVIPGSAILSLDLRHARDGVRRGAVRRLLAEAAAIARRRGLRSSWKQTQDEGAVLCSPKMSELLATSVDAIQNRTLRLVSGAGHDAVVMAAVTEIAMLFVRCRDGLSHHPGEFASRADLEVAVRVMIDFLERLAKRYGN